MKKLLGIGFLFITGSLVYGQQAGYPMFAGTESSFANYFLSAFLKSEKEVATLCDTSLGMVTFQIGEDGRVTSVTMPSGFPEKVSNIIETIIRQSSWSVPKHKKKRNEILALPILLPVYISVETGCKPDDVRRGSGLEKDFRAMVANGNQAVMLNCLMMPPVSCVIPKGFEDPFLKSRE